MPSAREPSRWERGTALTARRLQEVQDTKAARITGTGVSRSGQNVTIAHDRNIRVARGWGGLVTANEAFDNNTARWTYTVQRAQLAMVATNQPTASIITGPGELTVAAINLGEMTNVTEPASSTAWYIDGKNLHATDWPSGVAPRPIGGGGTDGAHKQNTYVWVWGLAFGLYCFNVPTNIDGAC